MKKITFAGLLVAGLAAVGSQMAAAQGTSSQSTSADRTADAMTDQQLALLRRDIRSIKKQLIAANLTLTDSESTKFWQVSEQYSVETGKINDTGAEIIKQYSDEYGTQTDDQAEALIRMYREDYARAGYLVLPASELKDRFVAWQSYFAVCQESSTLQELSLLEACLCTAARASPFKGLFPGRGSCFLLPSSIPRCCLHCSRWTRNHFDARFAI